jgi:phosphoribosylamine--glycine ligase
MRSVLVVGSGAREHALVWKLRQSPDIDRLYVAPGNAGTHLVAENVPASATDVEAITRLAEEKDVDLTVIGPEAPLARGLADRLREKGRAVVGPEARAARIESSKAFAKVVMQRAGVPTSRFAVFDEPTFAFRHLREASFPLVVKADGLAAGKGVVVCHDIREARAAIEAIMVDRIHGAAGERVVIEEALSGPEVSLLAFVDGRTVVPLPVAQDHKRLRDGDAGPNTGGMGAYAPVPFIDHAERARLTELVMSPVVELLARMGTPYRGILFAGLMLTADGPRVLEYNCRLGDPETQAILPLLAGDILPWLEATAAGNLADVRTGGPPLTGKSAVGVVLASPGYPELPEVGARIEGLKAAADDVLIFHAGTALDPDGRVITAGGRVLTIVGVGVAVDEAAAMAYAAPVRFEGMQRRGDIGVGSRSVMQPSVTPPTGSVAQPSVDASTRCSPSMLEGERAEGRHHVADAASRSTEQRGPSAEGIEEHARAERQGEMGPLPHRSHGGLRYISRKPRIGVLASGEGSNLQAVIDACNQGAVDAEIAVVASHNPRARALLRAERDGIPSFAVPLNDRRDPAARRRHEERLLEILVPFDLDLLVLAGWMLILSADFLGSCRFPVINVHPALLDPVSVPILRGAHAVRDALALGLPYTGVSVHLVTPEVDAGPVIVSEPVEIRTDDTEVSLYGRIKTVEHRLLPQAIHMVLTQQLMSESVNTELRLNGSNAQLITENR